MPVHAVARHRARRLRRARARPRRPCWPTRRPCCWRVGRRPRRGRRVHAARAPGRVAAWVATVFGAVYVGLLGFVARLGLVAPDLPAGAPLNASRRDAGLDPPPRPGGLGYDTGATSSGDAGAGPVPRPHLAVQDVRRASSAGSSATTVVVAAMLWAARRGPAGRPDPGAGDRPRRPGRRPRRVDAQAGRRRQGLGVRSSRATAASSTGSTRSCSPPRS